MKRIIAELQSLIRLIVTIVFWVGSAMYLYHFLLSDAQVRSRTFYMFIFLSILSFLIFVVISLWQKYNFHLFGRLDRRHFPPLVTCEEMGKIFSLDGDAVEKLRLSSITTMSVVKESTAKNAQGKKVVAVVGDDTFEIGPPVVPPELTQYIRKSTPDDEPLG